MPYGELGNSYLSFVEPVGARALFSVGDTPYSLIASARFKVNVAHFHSVVSNKLLPASIRNCSHRCERENVGLCRDFFVAGFFFA